MPDRLFSVGSDATSALRWSANLAANGNRPFVFFSWEETQNGFGAIRQDICPRGAAVTLIVEARAASDRAKAPSSAGLAGIRQLPNLSVLSPKDATELRQMLSWCASQSEPALIWLPQDRRVGPVTWSRAAPRWSRGRAEELVEGDDVAIVAWGPMVAAAAVGRRSTLAESRAS